MPPKGIKTVRQLIYWEYAKLIAGSAVGDRKNFAFVMHTYKRLEGGKLKPSSILRENKLLVTGEKNCTYCDASGELQWEHIIPKSRGGPDTIDNLVLACPSCNQKKGNRSPFEWYGKEQQYELPRLVLGKYLKLVYDMHEEAATLDSADLNADGQLDIFDLDAVLSIPVRLRKPCRDPA